MRKLNWMLIAVLLISSLLIIGCFGDEGGDGNGTTDPPFDPEDSDYFFSLVRFDAERGMFGILITQYDGDPITNVTLLVDNVPVTIESYYDEWFGSAEFTANQMYNFDLSINRSNYNFDLLIPVHPQTQWPDEYNPIEGMDIYWNLNPNVSSMGQEISGTSWIWDEDTWEYELIDEEWELLEPSARSYTVPAGWLSIQEEYDFVLLGYNFTTSGDLIAASIEGSGMTYGEDLREFTSRIADHIYYSITR